MGRTRGFTLVELLVVISVIAVLTALLLPALTRARLTAKAVTCTAQMRQAGLAALSYAGDFDDLIPIAAGSSPGWRWYDLVLPYLDDNRQVLTCPGSIYRSSVAYGPMFQGTWNWRTWKYVGGVGYLQNNWGDNLPANMAVPVRPNTAWRDPMNSLYVGEAYIHFYSGGTATVYPTPEDALSFPSEHLHKVGPARRTVTAWNERAFADRHLGTNVFMLDGSAKRWQTAQLDAMLEGAPGTIWDVF